LPYAFNTAGFQALSKELSSLLGKSVWERVTSVGWPLIFYLNIPIGIVGFVMGFFLLHEYPANANPQFDLAGFVFSAAGLAAFLYGLSDVSTDGWGSTTVLSFLAVGLLSLAIFVVVELVTASLGRQPLLDVRLFSNRTFTIGNLAFALVLFGLFGARFWFPFTCKTCAGRPPMRQG
jgi:hypothetical protein